MSEYNVKIESFEGPMDLLVFLIKKNRIDIYNIPIAEITEQYIGYLDTLKRFNIEFASEFLVLASTLLLIKSRMMLPKKISNSDDDEQEIDPRAELVERIIEYNRFKELSDYLQVLAEKQSQSFSRQPAPVHHRPTIPQNLSLCELIEAFNIAIKVKKELEIPNVIVAQEEYDVAKQMEIILSIVDTKQKVRFEELFLLRHKEEIIVTFLALLELIKQRILSVTQSGLYGEIYISALS